MKNKSIKSNESTNLCDVKGLSAEDIIKDNDQFSSRRKFLGKTGNILAAGAFAHLVLLGGKAFAADDACPGGLPAADTCDPPDNSDRCPGEEAPADYCPDDGNRDEDSCASGISSADVCNESTVSNSDQCASGNSSDDSCDGTTSTTDYCPTGQASLDNCPSDGGLDVDNCFGGGATTNGEVQDTCEEGGAGDECPTGKWGSEDDCKETDPDECTFYDDDTCYNGTNSSSGDGGDDSCFISPLFDSDQCNSGSSAEDKCTEIGETDVCPGGGTAVDTCEAGEDEDYCVGGASDNDECGEPADADECPGGVAPEDSCPGGSPPEDECPAGVSCADV